MERKWLNHQDVEACAAKVQHRALKIALLIKNINPKMNHNANVWSANVLIASAQIAGAIRKNMSIPLLDVMRLLKRYELDFLLKN
jgi:hypothetical protein